MVSAVFPPIPSTDDKSSTFISYNSSSVLIPAVLNFFTIDRGGALGYLLSVGQLRNILQKNKYDVVHAHYSFSGIVASLARAEPLVVSLMGSDISVGKLNRLLLNFFINNFWRITIVKSHRMKEFLSNKEVIILPNGVNLSKFYPLDKRAAIEKLNKMTNCLKPKDVII